MANYNRVILVGNLTRDPQLRYTPSQMAVCDIGLAINRKWKAADGQMKEEVCFVDCTAWGRQAETLQKFVTKGQPLFVEGRLTYRQWDGKDGKKHSKLEVTVEGFQFLGGPRTGGAGASGSPRAAAAPDAQRQTASGEAPQAPPDYDFTQDVDDDTIPF
ncbi:MAG: single-stranded DNA-binding protein [Planctomycetes bacterium]|nr:single-stranded DNA-binding protein [Planctomycetota bacterium]